LLLEQGYEVIGVTMKTYAFDEVGGNLGNETSCCGLDAFNDARMVAVKLGIPHYVVDFTGQFETHVIRDFVDEYFRGRTPNPCVICNREIKWGALIRKAQSLGAEHIATGHYARIRRIESTGRYAIARARDLNKDQSYALWALSQDNLSKTLFPLGELTKPEVRSLAEKYGLKTAAKEESFEICFVTDNNYRRFLLERAGTDKTPLAGGAILREGKPVGHHEGYPFYTIGQRSGIGAHGERVYVTDIDAAGNTITIGRNDDLLRNELIAGRLNLVSLPALPSALPVDAKVRYKDDATAATVFPADGDRCRVVFTTPKRAITPGQSVVFYDGDLLVGGGIIEQVMPRETVGRGSEKNKG
jgi:tRNA-specific 2-thiouridylase